MDVLYKFSNIDKDSKKLCPLYVSTKILVKKYFVSGKNRLQTKMDAARNILYEPLKIKLLIYFISLIMY